MPHRRVYGKRSRAIYDPFAVFASPQQAADEQQQPLGNRLSDEKTVLDKLCRLDLEDTQDTGCQQQLRQVLAEKNANIVVKERTPERQVVDKTKEFGQVAQKDSDTLKESTQRELEDETDYTNLSGLRRRSTRQTSRAFQNGAVTRLEITDTPASTVETTGLHGTAFKITATQTSFIESEENSPQILQSSPTPTTLNEYEKHCQSLLSLSLHPLTSFSEWSDQMSTHLSVAKIAEASFGEVYRLSLRQQILDLSSAEESVLKIIALKPPDTAIPTEKRRRAVALKRSDAMSDPKDVRSEVNLLQRMGCTPGFTNFREIRILQGRPSGPFIEAFKEYNAAQRAKDKESSIFPDPAKKASYADDQLWALIEMQDAGTDLERIIEDGKCSSVWSVWDVFWQVVLSLAKGEEEAEFEHRDLHLGNICVRMGIKTADIASAVEAGKKLNFTGLETTLIDYTISRCQMSKSGTPEDTAFIDLSLPSQRFLFEGDSTEEYQYDIYRYMRSALYLDNPLASYPPRTNTHKRTCATRGWQDFRPATNLVWIHFVLYKLLEQVEWPSAEKAPNCRAQRGRRALWKRANALEHVLLKVHALLDPAELACKDSLKSASDLVALALGEGWLNVEDVVGGDGTNAEVDVELTFEDQNIVQCIGSLQPESALVQESGIDTPVDTTIHTRGKT